ncbi:MAG: hypothetical protein LAT62_13010 [Natronospirillum sp.]|uniref:hypothetical protein n=1 Tax=Natronospirillum sp. TaxID=2812955 RepID=UPI0025EC4F99|nr:hypothetical protein [Natronospirillum sp.]MCH8552851.1 hypothetical protein [Natronospirillum sp.]
MAKTLKAAFDFRLWASIWLVLSLPGLATAQATSQEIEPAGVFAQVSGSVSLDRAGAQSQRVTSLDLLYAGDRIETGATGRVLVRFVDDTLLDLGPNTRIHVDTWRRQAGQPEANRLVVNVEAGQTRWLTRDGGDSYLLRGEGASVRSIAPDSDFELLQSTERGTEVALYTGTLTVSNTKGLANLGQDLAYAQAMTANDLETLSTIPDAAAMRGVTPQENRELRFTRWPWLFRDTPRDDVDGSVMWADSLTVRYRERTNLPEPQVQTSGLMPISTPMAEEVDELAEEESAPEPETVEPPPEADDRLNQLASLIRQRRHLEAFQLAESMRNEFEGEPEFDVLYGRAAMNVGEYQRSVFALERAAINLPRDNDVRLLLAEAYIGMRNTSAARRQLDRLEQRPLTQAQQTRWETLDRRLQRLKLAAQQTQSFTLGAELQYYTNINSGLNRSSLDIEPDDGPAFTFTPDSGAQAEGAPALQLQASYNRSTPLNQRLRRTLQVGATTRQSTFTDAVNYGGLLSVGLEHTNGRSGALQLLPAWTVDGFLLTTQVSAQQRDFYRSLNLGASLAWTAREEDQTLLLQTQLSDSFEAAGLPTDWRATLSANVSDNEQSNFLGAGGALQPTWQPAGNFVYQGLLGAQTRFYLEDNPIYGERRTDLELNTQVLALRPISETSVVTGRVSYNHIFSNQNLYEYYGAELAIGYQHTW